MILTCDDVAHIAKLAQLELSEAELMLYPDQLTAILEYAAWLQTLDTNSAAPTLPPGSVLREDTLHVGLARETTLANAPAIEDGYFIAPPTR